jgi:hypothetical protein
MSYLCVYIYMYTHGTEKEKVSEREQEGGEEKRRSLRAFGKLRAGDKGGGGYRGERHL